MIAMFAVSKVYDRSKKVRFARTTLLRFCGHLSSTTGEQSLSISTICVHQLVNLPSKQCPLSIAKATPELSSRQWLFTLKVQVGKCF